METLDLSRLGADPANLARITNRTRSIGCFPYYEECYVTDRDQAPTPPNHGQNVQQTLAELREAKKTGCYMTFVLSLKGRRVLGIWDPVSDEVQPLRFSDLEDAFDSDFGTGSLEVVLGEKV